MLRSTVFLWVVPCYSDGLLCRESLSAFSSIAPALHGFSLWFTVCHGVTQVCTQVFKLCRIQFILLPVFRLTGLTTCFSPYRYCIRFSRFTWGVYRLPPADLLGASRSSVPRSTLKAYHDMQIICARPWRNFLAKVFREHFRRVGQGCPTLRGCAYNWLGQ